MSLIYRIKLTSTNYPLTPLYKVYYDGNTNNIPTISNTGQPANNLSYSQLIGEGIQVVVPDGTSSISLTHIDCGTTVNVSTSNAGSLYVEFTKTVACGTQKTYINDILVSQLNSNGGFNGVLNTGDTFQVQIVNVGSGCMNTEYSIQISSSTRGTIYANIMVGTHQSPIITRQNGEDFTVLISSDL